MIFFNSNRNIPEAVGIIKKSGELKKNSNKKKSVETR